MPILFAYFTGLLPDVFSRREAREHRSWQSYDVPFQAVRRGESARPGKGELLFAFNCAPCHHATGEGNAAFNAPALAGQRTWYLDRQLRYFRDGTRGAHPRDLQGMQMAPMVRLLTDGQALNAVVAHIGRMTPFSTPSTLEGDAEKGKALFTGTCLPCHGEKGQGNKLTNAPRIAGQADWYLLRQLTKFKEGVRGAHEKDTAGMQMAAMAKTLMDEQAMQDLVVYINGLPRKTLMQAEDQASEGAFAPTARGEELFRFNCAPCHRLEGGGNVAFSAPALAGQHEWYLVRQLHNFKEGARGAHAQDLQGMQMMPMARLLPDDQAIGEVAAHIAAMAPFDAPSSLQGDAEKGKAQFKGICLPCHGEKGQGNPLTNAPRIGGQADWYLLRQLTKFKEGVRGAHEKDTFGMQMAAMAKTLMDEQAMKDLSVYINSLQ